MASRKRGGKNIDLWQVRLKRIVGTKKLKKSIVVSGGWKLKGLEPGTETRQEGSQGVCQGRPQEPEEGAGPQDFKEGSQGCDHRQEGGQADRGRRQVEAPAGQSHRQTGRKGRKGGESQVCGPQENRTRDCGGPRPHRTLSPRRIASTPPFNCPFLTSPRLCQAEAKHMNLGGLPSNF